MKKTQFNIITCVLLALAGISFAEENTWTRKNDMPTPRWVLATSVVKGKIYAIGGSPGGLSFSTPIVEMYDPITDIWTMKADMPTARWGLSTSVVNGKIYAIGGTPDSVVLLSTVEEYDPVTDTWTPKADMPTARRSFSTSVVNGKIYAIGGWDGTRVSAAVEEYDPVTDTWVRKNDMPTARWYPTASMVNGEIYVIGGGTSGPGSVPGVVLSIVEVYDPSTDMWAVKANMLTPKRSHSASVVNGKIYVIGGSVEGRRQIKTVEEYDTTTNTWTTRADMPTAGRGLSTSAFNGYIYAIGGENRFQIVEAYDTGVGIRVTDIFPDEGLVAGGETIAIFGSGFPDGASVTIGGELLDRLNMTDIFIIGVTPPGTEGEQDVWITALGLDYSVLAGKFFYYPPSGVVVREITPPNGKQDGGDTGIISGRGFLTGATVTIDGNPATDVGVISTLIIFTIPTGTEGAKDVVVINPDGQKGILRGGYTYNPFPVIEEITPEYGGPPAGGTEITITGEHFMQGVDVYIGENHVSRLDLFSPTELRLKTPPGTPGEKAVRVVNPDGQGSLEEAIFSYNGAPVIFSVKPDAGALEGGTPIAITGEYFILPDVFIGGAEARYEDKSSSTRIIARTPSSTAGAKDVEVVNLDGQKDTLKDAFTYNPKPDIESVSPNNGRLDGGTKITIYGSNFLPGAKVSFSTDTTSYIAALSTQYVSSTEIIAVTPPSTPGPRSVRVLNPDRQDDTLEDGFTYNALPTITSITPNYGSSAGGTKIIIEGTGFIQGVRVMIGENTATAQMQDDTTIEAITPSNPPGVWKVRVVNPDEQESVESKDFISLGEMAYNYPNPFRASQGTTFRYVTDDPVQSITVKIFNLAGVPIDVVQQLDSNEVKWQNTEVHVGLYVYLLEV